MVQVIVVFDLQLMFHLDGWTSEVLFVLLCSQTWPKKEWKNVMCSVCECFPPWSLDDSHSDAGVAGKEEPDCICSRTSCAPIAEVICILCPMILKWKCLRGKNGTGKWSWEMTLESCVRAWFGTLLIRCSQWNVIITNYQTTTWALRMQSRHCSVCMQHLTWLQSPRWKYCRVIT